MLSGWGSLRSLHPRHLRRVDPEGGAEAIDLLPPEQAPPDQQAPPPGIGDSRGGAELPVGQPRPVAGFGETRIFHSEALTSHAPQNGGAAQGTQGKVICGNFSFVIIFRKGHSAGVANGSPKAANLAGTISRPRCPRGDPEKGMAAGWGGHWEARALHPSGGRALSAR